MNFQTLKLLTQEDYMLPTYRYSDITAITGVGEFISYWIIAVVVRKKNPDLEIIPSQIVYTIDIRKTFAVLELYWDILLLIQCLFDLEYDLRCKLLLTQCLYLIYSKLTYHAFLQLMVLYIRIRTNLK